MTSISYCEDVNKCRNAAEMANSLNQPLGVSGYRLKSETSQNDFVSQLASQVQTQSRLRLEIFHAVTQRWVKIFNCTWKKMAKIMNSENINWVITKTLTFGATRKKIGPINCIF